MGRGKESLGLISWFHVERVSVCEYFDILTLFIHSLISSRAAFKSAWLPVMGNQLTL